MTEEAAAADHVAAKEFPTPFKASVAEGSYTPQQVFNIDEPGLFWKRMQSQTFISIKDKTMPEFKAAAAAATGRQRFRGLQIKASHGVSVRKYTGTERICKNKIACCLEGK
jgi:hypothetical protein